jgi:hypothetical protein
MSMHEVAAIVEAEAVRAGQMDLIENARKAAPLAAAPVYQSKGVPSFGEKTIAPTKNRVEIVGETCESCSA